MRHRSQRIQSFNIAKKLNPVSVAKKLEHEHPIPFLCVLRALCENIPCIYEESDSAVAVAIEFGNRSNEFGPTGPGNMMNRDVGSNSFDRHQGKSA